MGPYKRRRSSRSPTPARVISGVVLLTTGGLSVAGLLFEVYVVIERGHIVLTCSLYWYHKLASPSSLYDT
jgi:hypothetical protein